MLDRVWGGSFLGGSDRRRASRARTVHRPQVEGLEGRALLTAALAAISPVTVPQSLGYSVPLDGSASGATSQTFTVTSSNPDIKVSAAQGKFLTFTLNHTPASGQPTDPAITNGTVTMQLFDDLTPMTAGKIESFVTSGYYNGKTIHRIQGNFTGPNLPNDYVIQGGAPNPDGTGNSGLPGTPFGLELVQQLAFASPDSLAMANTGLPNSNDTQFFWATGSPTQLDFNYTIFGQVSSDPTTQATISKIEQIATTPIPGGNLGGTPISPLTITTASLSNTSPDGTLHVDATGAVSGETSTVTVTATDPATNTTATKTFLVTVGPDSTNHPSTFTFKPLAAPVTQAAAAGTATTVQLAGTTQNPNNKAVTLQYGLATQPAHGTISNFNATTGGLTYTANAGYTGPDSFTYSVTNLGGTPTPLAGNTQTVMLNVSNTPVVTPVNTGAVRVIGTVLVVTPLPRTDGGTNTISLMQQNVAGSPANSRLVVLVNGQVDSNNPLTSSITRVVIYGSKANDNINVDKGVDATIPITLDGGHGGKNVIQAGAAATRMHGWFGYNTLIGGSGANQMVGRKGHVTFRATPTTNQIALAVPRTPQNHLKTGQVFYFRYKNGKLVPSAK